MHRRGTDDQSTSGTPIGGNVPGVELVMRLQVNAQWSLSAARRFIETMFPHPKGHECQTRCRAPAEIDVRGNDQSIPDGDATPAADDHTNFGNVMPGQSLSQVFESTTSVIFRSSHDGGVAQPISGLIRRPLRRQLKRFGNRPEASARWISQEIPD